MLPKLLRTTLIVIGLITVLIGGLVGILLYNNRPPHITVPTPKMPKPNGWDDFVLASKMIEKSVSFGPYSDPDRKPEQWSKAELMTFVNKVAPALQKVRQGLTKPYLSPPLDMKKFFGDLDVADNYYQVSEVGETLCGEARYYSVLGKHTRAADSLMDCIEFGVTLPRGGCFWSGVEHVPHIELMAARELSAVIPKLSQKDLAKVAKRLEQIQRKRVPYSDIILEDCRTDMKIYNMMFSEPDSAKYLVNPARWVRKGDSAKDVWENIRFSFLNKRAGIRELERYYKLLAKEQKAPYNGKLTVPKPIPILYNEWPDVNDIYSRRSEFVRSEAFFVINQTEVALRRYYADHGAYPNKLSKLAPKYLKSIPSDPFGGKPLKYQSKKNGRDFLLYSISENMKDDRGKPFPWDGDWSNGDLVAGNLMKAHH